MIIRNVTREDLYRALDSANDLYSGNLKFNRFDLLRVRRDGSQVWTVTLSVRSSKEPGHRLGFSVSEKTGLRSRISAACWHAHGTFFAFLPDAATIQVSRQGQETRTNRSEWIDRNIGSIYRPLYFSDACECGNAPYSYDQVMRMHATGEAVIQDSERRVA